MNDKYGFDPFNILFYNDEGLLTFLFDVKTSLTEEKLKKLIGLIGHHFEGSTFKEDYFITSNISMPIEEYLNNYFILKPGMYNDIYMNIPIYIQSLDGSVHKEMTSGYYGIKFFYDLVEDGDEPLYGLTIYPYAYFDYSTINKMGTLIDQRIAAKKNRVILRDFLMACENEIQAKVDSIIDCHPHIKDFVYEYGIKENAKYTL